MNKKCHFYETFPTDVHLCHAGHWGDIECGGDTGKCEIHTRFDNLQKRLTFVGEKCGDMLKSIRNAKETLEDMYDGIDEWDVNAAGLYGDLGYIEAILKIELSDVTPGAAAEIKRLQEEVDKHWRHAKMSTFS